MTPRPKQPVMAIDPVVTASETSLPFRSMRPWPRRRSGDKDVATEGASRHPGGADTSTAPDYLALGVGDEWVQDVVDAVRPFTMTSAERIYGLCLAVQYVCRQDIPGALVECGVWRGGSAMAMALTLDRMGARDRDLVLFDTFSGMTPPEAIDRDVADRPAAQLLASENRMTSSVWAYATLDDVTSNLATTGYGNVSYVVGDVEQTIPGQAPERVALLRLDTDWYRSTLHELLHLVPRVSPRGVLIVDDYGHWSGAHQAVDQYFEGQATQPFLCPLDYTGRLAILP